MIEKSHNAAIKNEEKALAKKTYTYNYNGEIIFVKRNDNDRLPTTMSQPRFGTRTKAVSQMPESTIHKVQNVNLSQEEYKETLFKPEPQETAKPKTKVKLHKYFYTGDMVITWTFRRKKEIKHRVNGSET